MASDNVAPVMMWLRVITALLTATLQQTTP